jgi:hypothetical protein
MDALEAGLAGGAASGHASSSSAFSVSSAAASAVARGASPALTDRSFSLSAAVDVGALHLSQLVFVDAAMQARSLTRPSAAAARARPIPAAARRNAKALAAAASIAPLAYAYRVAAGLPPRVATGGVSGAKTAAAAAAAAAAPQQMSQHVRNRLFYGGYEPPPPPPAHLLGEHLRTGGFAGYGDAGEGGYDAEAAGGGALAAAGPAAGFARRRLGGGQEGELAAAAAAAGDGGFWGGAAPSAGAFRDAPYVSASRIGETGVGMSALAAAAEISGTRGGSGGGSGGMQAQTYGSGGLGRAQGPGWVRVSSSVVGGPTARWAQGPPTAFTAEGAADAHLEAAARERAALARLLDVPSYEEVLARGDRVAAAAREGAFTGPGAGEGPSAYKTKSGFGASASEMLDSLGAGARGAEGFAMARTGRLAAERKHDRIDKRKKEQK